MHRTFFILAFIAFILCTSNAQSAPDKTTTDPTWEEKVVPVLIGGALTLVGGLVSQGLFLWLNRRHERATLLVALRSELKLTRENIGANVQGFCDSLRSGEAPSAEQVGANLASRALVSARDKPVATLARSAAVDSGSSHQGLSVESIGISIFPGQSDVG